MEELGYQVSHLRELGSDDDVCILSNYVAPNKLIKVYTEHQRIFILTYFMSPNNSHHVIIRDLDESECLFKGHMK